MKRIGILAALAAALASSGAYAADPFAKGSTKDDGDVFASPGVVNWSGVWVGGRIGYGNANHDLSTETYGNEEDITFFGVDGKNSAGAIGGGQVGFDLARGRFLFGVFGSYDFSGMETEVTLFDETRTLLEKGDEWSIGGRVGLIVAPRTMAYVLAAYTQTEYTFAGASDDGGDKDVTFDGVTVGGGVEFAVSSNIFLGLEGTHTFYGKETIWDVDLNDDGDGLREVDDLGETKIMGTLKLKVGGGLPGLN